MWQIKYINREGEYFTTPYYTINEFNVMLESVVSTAVCFSIIFINGDKL